MSDLILRHVRPWGTDPVDITIRGTAIVDVRSHSTDIEPPAGDVIGGRGLLALPGLINAHAHVDKSWWGQPWVSYGGEGTTQGRIAHERAERDRLGIPSVEATVTVLREFLRHGTTAVRSHVDVDQGVGLRGLEIVQEAVERLGHTITVETVAFPQDGVLRRPGVLDLLDRAASGGAPNIGGLDPASIDRDPVGQLDGLFAIADRHGVGIDIHLHDGAELGAFQIELIIDRVQRLGLQGKVNVAHGFALGQLAPTRQTELVQALAEAQISYSTVAPVGSAPLPLTAMRAAGVLVGLGTDGIRDLWSPYGDGDLLRVATTFARLHGLRHDDDLHWAVEQATTLAAPFVHRTQHDLAVGSRADLVLIDAENVADVLMRAPQRSLVIAGGVVVARDGEVVV